MEKYYAFHPSYGTVFYTTEEGTKHALLSWILFTIYLASITAVGNSLTTHQQYSFIRGVRQLFERTAYISESSTLSFNRVTTIPNFWSYLEYNVIPLLHGVVYDDTVEWNPQWVNRARILRGRVFLNESLLLGAPRLRQIRVKQDSCYVHPAFAQYFDTCLATYSTSAESKEPFYKGTEYKTMIELGSLPIQGVIHNYPSGGYVAPLTYNRDASLGMINQLQNIQWLDRASRLVLFEINMINMNLDMLHSIKLIFEIMPTGLINPKYESNAIYMDPLIISSGLFIMTCAVIVYLTNVYYTYVEIKKLYMNGFKYYFTRISTILHLPRVVIIYLSLFYTIYIYFYGGEKYIEISEVEHKFIPLDYLISAYAAHRYAIGVVVFVSWLTLLRFMEFNPVLRTIGFAMKMALTDLVSFAVMFVIAFVAFGTLGVLLFGAKNKNFKNFPTAFLTMTRMLVGDFDNFELIFEFEVLGPVFFLTFVLLVFFILLNMFLAAIVLSYRTATATASFKPSFLWYYIRKQLYRVSAGLFTAPRYPEWAREHYHALDQKGVRHLSIIKESMEIETDLHILITRLDIIENYFYCLTNNVEDLIAEAKLESKYYKKNQRT